MTKGGLLNKEGNKMSFDEFIQVMSQNESFENSLCARHIYIA